MKAHAGRRVITRELADAVAEFPETVELKATDLKACDVLITVLGFEERCLAVPEALASASHTAGAVAVCRYRTNPDDNAINRRGLDAYLAQVTVGEPRELDIAGDLAADLRDVLKAGAGTDRKRPNVLFDISVASNALIVRVLSVLLECDIDLRLLYAEADTYRPTKEEYDELSEGSQLSDEAQLAKGVLDVTVVSELPGRHAVGIPHRIVVFPGFDRDRVRAAISQVDNDFVVEIARAPLTWMIGQPLHEEDRWRQTALTELHQVPADHEQHVVSTFDYRESMYALEDVNRAHGLKSNMSIVPLGSKMQAVGITLYCFARPDIAVIVSQPREYSAVAYTRGARQLWHLPLGSTQALINALRSVDTISLQSLNSPETLTTVPD